MEIPVIMATLNEFDIYNNKALDWYFNSLKFKRGSDEWTICRLKYKIYRRKAAGFAKRLWMN